MDMGLVVQAECTERVIIAVRQGILPRKNRLSVQVDDNVVAVADFLRIFSPPFTDEIWVRANATLAPLTRPLRISSRDGIGNIAGLDRYRFTKTNSGSSACTFSQ